MNTNALGVVRRLCRYAARVAARCHQAAHHLCCRLHTYTLGEASGNPLFQPLILPSGQTSNHNSVGICCHPDDTSCAKICYADPLPRRLRTRMMAIAFFSPVSGTDSKDLGLLRLFRAAPIDQLLQDNGADGESARYLSRCGAAP